MMRSRSSARLGYARGVMPRLSLVRELAPLLGFVALGCASLTAEQQAAVSRVIVMRSDPAPECQNLGPVSGSRDTESATGIRGRTVLLGGNTVRVDAPGMLSSDGAAFFCPPPKPPPAPVPVIGPAAPAE
jgi:hypothetical protein